MVPSVRLTHIFRQGERSQIVEQAHRINEGLMPQWPREPQHRSDFYVVNADEPNRASEIIVSLVAERIPRRFCFDAMKDIQVLCPMNRGSIGATTLNEQLQEALNPSSAEVTRFGRSYREGDRVLQTVNDYAKGGPWSPSHR